MLWTWHDTEPYASAAIMQQPHMPQQLTPRRAPIPQLHVSPMHQQPSPHTHAALSFTHAHIAAA